MRPFTLLILALLMLQVATVWADGSVNYSAGGLRITRTLTVRQIGNFNPSTGATIPVFESRIDLVIANPGARPINRIIVQEDLGYIPSQTRISYSARPYANGRTARWSIPTLLPGEEWRVWLTVPAPIPDSAMRAAGAPSVQYDRPRASLAVPSEVEQGETVTLRLLAPDATPIRGAGIERIGPDGRRALLISDANGVVRFVALAGGFYTYSVPEYETGSVPSTESRPRVPETPAAGALTPLPPNLPPPEKKTAPDLWSFWPLAAGLLLVAAMAFALYSYFASGSGAEYAPMPPAPSVRPIRAGMEEPALPTPVGGMNEPGALKEGAGSQTTAFLPESEMKALTRDMIARRRGGQSAAQENEPEEAVEATEGMPDIAQAPDASGGLAAPLEGKEWEGRPPVQNPQEPARSSGSGETEEACTETASSERYEALDESEMDEEEAAVPRSRAPGWMTRLSQEEEGGESAEIDDDAIRKTIEELEQLRAELRGRAKSRDRPEDKTAEGGEPDTGAEEEEKEDKEREEGGRAEAISKPARRAGRNERTAPSPTPARRGASAARRGAAPRAAKATQKGGRRKKE